MKISVKYGQGQDQIRAGAGAGRVDTNNSYAMFSNNNLPNVAEVQKSQELRKRPGGPPSGGGHGTCIGGESISSNGVNYMNTAQGEGIMNSSSNYNNQNNQMMNNNYNPDSGLYNGTSSSSRSRINKKYDDNIDYNQKGGNYMQMQLQQQAPVNKIDFRMRVQGAEKVEKAIHQVLLFIFIFKIPSHAILH